METVDSDSDTMATMDAISTLNTGSGGLADGPMHNTVDSQGLSGSSIKTEQSSPMGTVMSLANQMSTGLTPGGLFTMGTPLNLADQLVVAVQNVNGVDVREDTSKNDSGSFQLSNALQAAKVNGTSTMASLTAAPTMQASPLAGMMGLAGLPQMAALAGIPGLPNLSVVGQLAAATQVIQAAAAANCQTPVPNSAPSPVFSNNASPAVAVSANGHAMQQVPQLATQGMTTQHQLATTPQFILAAGQPIQGIQGAQLLIPTSSGVATQQIITIPVSQVAAGNQLVQLVASNGQVFTTTLANVQALSHPLSIPGVAAPSNAGSTVPPHSMLAASGNFPSITGQVATLPQIFTNAAGQVVAVGPHILAHPMISANQAPNLMHLTSQPAPAQLPQLTQQPPQLQAPQSQPTPQPQHNHIQQQPTSQEEKLASQTNGQAVSLMSKPQASIPPPLVPAALATLQPSATQLALNSVAMVTTQLTAATQAKQLTTAQTVAEHIQQTQSMVSALTQTPQPPAITSPAISENSLQSQQSNTISNTDANVVDGINLEEIKEFAKAFKIRRLSLGLTQTQVGQALSATEGPSYSQSAICRFEKLDITPKSAQKIKPVLEMWMKEAEERYKNGAHNLTEFIGSEPTKKRKRRTSFTPAALEILNLFFEKNTHPSGAEMTELAEKLNYDREVVRVWFCNKRQALKNTIKKLKGSNP